MQLSSCFDYFNKDRRIPAGLFVQTAALYFFEINKFFAIFYKNY